MPVTLFGITSRNGGLDLDMVSCRTARALGDIVGEQCRDEMIAASARRMGREPGRQNYAVSLDTTAIRR